MVEIKASYVAGKNINTTTTAHKSKKINLMIKGFLAVASKPTTAINASEPKFLR